MNVWEAVFVKHVEGGNLSIISYRVEPYRCQLIITCVIL